MVLKNKNYYIWINQYNWLETHSPIYDYIFLILLSPIILCFAAAVVIYDIDWQKVSSQLKKPYQLRQKAKQISTEKEAIKAIYEDHNIFKYLRKFRSNTNVVKAALRKRTFYIKYASRNLRDSDEIIQYMMSRHKTDRNCEGFKFVSRRLRNNQKIASKALKYNILNIKYLSKKTKSNKTFLSSAIKSSLENQAWTEFTLTLIPKKIRAHRDILELIISKKPYIIFTKEFIKIQKPDVHLLALAASHDSSIYLILPDELKAEKAILISALHANKFRNYVLWPSDSTELIKKAPKILRNDLGIAELLMREGMEGYRYLSSKIKNNKKIALLALKIDVNNYMFCSKNLQKDLAILDRVKKNAFLSINPATPKINTSCIKILVENGLDPVEIYKNVDAKRRRLKYLYTGALNAQPQLIALEKNLNSLLKLNFSSLSLEARHWCFQHYKTLYLKSRNFKKLDILQIAHNHKQVEKMMLISAQVAFPHRASKC